MGGLGGDNDLIFFFASLFVTFIAGLLAGLRLRLTLSWSQRVFPIRRPTEPSTPDLVDEPLGVRLVAADRSFTRDFNASYLPVLLALVAGAFLGWFGHSVLNALH